MPHATLRARLGVIAATTVLSVIGVFAASATASTTTPPDPAPTTTASPDPTLPVLTVTAPSATTDTSTHAVASKRRHYEAKIHRVLREAARQKGKPYVYGAAGPHAFDCSGLVRYVFMHAVGRVLPHNAAAQYHSVRHIRRSSLQPGDLIFTDNGYISHVGIYAGHHHWWVAPHTGTHVQLQRIYHAHFLYGRVLVWNSKTHHAANHARRHHSRRHR
jgi:cell wall-associated NlpC family hydrolase